MKKLTALAAALMLGIAAFAAVDGAQASKKDKSACCKESKAACCKECKDGPSKSDASKDKAGKTPKAPEKEG